MASGPDLVVVGVVGKPFGVAGLVHVRPDPDVDHDFAPGTRYESADLRLEVTEHRRHSGRTLVGFAGVDDRDAALALRGAVLRVPRAAVSLDDDAWWSADVVGRPVTGPDGRRVGVVEDVADGPAHDYLVVRLSAGTAVLVPAVSDLVEVTRDGVVVADLPGLLDPGQAL